MSKFQNTHEECHFGPWHISATKSHILPSEGVDRKQFESQLDLPHVPEMIFAKNCLRISHEGGFGVEFTALDALKRVNSERELIQVAGAQEWKAARADCEHIDNIIHPFDWTFATDYSGTLLGNISTGPTETHIDIERLKGKEKIAFYADIPLFEDELHDCGCSVSSVRIRVMPTYFFVLMRFYMRVDGVLVRVNDTRLYHEAGTDFILREFTTRENKVEQLNVPTSVLIDANEIVDHLSVQSTTAEKLMFPPTHATSAALTSSDPVL